MFEDVGEAERELVVLADVVKILVVELAFVVDAELLTVEDTRDDEEAREVERVPVAVLVELTLADERDFEVELCVAEVDRTAVVEARDALLVAEVTEVCLERVLVDATVVALDLEEMLDAELEARELEEIAVVALDLVDAVVVERPVVLVEAGVVDAILTVVEARVLDVD